MKNRVSSIIILVFLDKGDCLVWELSENDVTTKYVKGCKQKIVMINSKHKIFYTKQKK